MVTQRIFNTFIYLFSRFFLFIYFRFTYFRFNYFFTYFRFTYFRLPIYSFIYLFILI